MARGELERSGLCDHEKQSPRREQEGPQNHHEVKLRGHVHVNLEGSRTLVGHLQAQTQTLDNHGGEPTYLVLGVEDNSLGVGHADHVVVKASSGQPDSGRELVVKQGEL